MITMFVEIMLVPALPLIIADFPGDAQWISWVLSIYLLVGAVATPLVGRLGDVYGKKRVMLVVMAIYLIALIGCGFSLEISNALLGTQSIFVLLFFRGLQGIGMGMFTLAFGIVRDTFPREKIPVAIGLISAMFSVGVSIGLVIGGWITSVAHWYDAFHVVTPFFFGLAVASFYLIKDPLIVKRGSLDIPGSILLGSGVFLFLLALTQGEEWGWESPAVLGLIAISAALVVLFILVERRSKDPIVRPSLLKNRGIFGSNVVALFVGLTMFLVFQTLPFYLQTPIAVGGHFGLQDTFTVGLYMLPSAAAQLIFGPIGGMASRRYEPAKVLAVGMLVQTIGFLLIVGFHTTFWDIALSLFVLGAGFALCMVSMINVVVESCPQAEFGVASGMNTLFRIVGGAVGPVLATVILAGNVVMVGPMRFYTEQGFIQTWTMAVVFAVMGLVAALALRPRPEDKCDIPAADLPPSGH